MLLILIFLRSDQNIFPEQKQEAPSKCSNALIMARMFPTSQSLFVERALSEVCQALKTLRQFNSCIYMQKFITILMKTDKQNSPQSSFPVTSFVLVIPVHSSALKKTIVPEPPLSLPPKRQSFHITAIFLRPPAFPQKNNSEQDYKAYLTSCRISGTIQRF